MNSLWNGMTCIWKGSLTPDCYIFQRHLAVTSINPPEDSNAVEFMYLDNLNIGSFELDDFPDEEFMAPLLHNESIVFNDVLNVYESENGPDKSMDYHIFYYV